MSLKALFVPLLLVCAASACVAPGTRDLRAVPCATPGWGRILAQREAHMTIRAVEASAQPTTPPTRLGQPGWGRRAAR